MHHRKRVEQYELLELAGQGEILAIYRARDTERNRPVILELVHPHLQDDAELVDGFHRRAEELARLRHPRIVPLRDTGASEQGLYLVTDVPAGESLARRLAGRGQFEVDDALSIVAQVADALDFAHDQGIIHRDVRPANIYLDDKTVQLTNFYLLETIGGAPVYMAPEQSDKIGVEVADQRSDTYALGVVVYEMLTGKLPFEDIPTAGRAADLTVRPTPPRIHNPDLPPAVDAILLKALAKQPQGRYQTAGELATALHKAVQIAQTRRMSGGEVFSKARPAETPIHSWPLDSVGGIPAWVWVAIGILLIVLAAIVILLATS